MSVNPCFSYGSRESHKPNHYRSFYQKCLWCHRFNYDLIKWSPFSAYNILFSASIALNMNEDFT